ncbi:MAG TPA: hypothetical protein VHY08_28545 [Bacillota bacterium]|nr:hypothetical protein [Bacillota bacterium]
MMNTMLKSNGNPVSVGGVVLRTPGLTGKVTVRTPGAPDMRAAELSSDELLAVLKNEGIEEQVTLEISDAREEDTGAAVTRSTYTGEPALELEVPAPGDDWGQIVLFTDESGVMNWSFARDDDNRLDTTRGGSTRVYRIPRRVAPSEDKAENRGLIGAIGKKIMKILVFPLVDPLIGKVGEVFVSNWEKAKRPYRLRTITPDNYASNNADLITGEGWSRYSGKRSLLIVHGTFSRAHSTIGGLPRDFVENLYNLYEGRIFAFDHYTLSEDPKENIEWFLRNLPDNLNLDLDIICHSRGGLVSRCLAEKQSVISMGARSIKVNKIIFAATPNAGTPLTDNNYMGDFIDSYTNLLNFFPDNGVTEILEAIVTLVKQLAVDALKGLRGLQSMNPEGKFLTQWLNKEPVGSASYYALGANFEPVNKGLKDWYQNRLMDKIFKAENDLVVPTNGVFAKNGSPAFPIDNKHIFNASDGVTHGGFFINPIARQKIMEWLR